MTSTSFYGSRKSSAPSSSRSRPSKRKRLDAASVRDAVSMGEAIRMSDGVEKSGEGVLDDLSDLSDLESDFEGELRGQPETDESELPFNDSGNMYSFEHVTTPHTSTPLSTRSHSPRSNNDTPASTSLTDLIQRQNQLIMELLSKQDSMTSAIEEVKHDLKETRSHVDQLMEAQQNKVIDTDKNHKRKYPSSLTERLSKLHQSSENQFNPEKGVNDTHNAGVKAFLKSEILASNKDEYSDSQISLAIQRLYENQRQTFLNCQPENVGRAQHAEVKKKYRARRERLFARRSKHVPQKLRKHWDRLNLHYMSEEEDADEGDGIVVKKLPWRSDKLNDIIKKLDAAADTAAKSVSTFTPDCKRRVESSDPSVLYPPADAPDWALKPEYRKGPKLANKENEVTNY